MAAIVLPIVGPWLVWLPVLQWQRSCCQLLVLGWSGYMCSNGGDRAANSWSLVGLGTCAPMAAIVLPIVGPWLVWVPVLQWQRSCCQFLVLGWSGYLCSNGSDRAANCWSLVGLVTCAPMAAIVLPIVGPWLVWVHVLQWRRSCCQLLVLGWSGYLCSNGSDRAANSWSLVGLVTCAPMAAIVLPIVGPWLVWVHVLQWQRSCCQLLVLGWSGYLCSNGSDRAANSWSLVGLVTCAPMAAIVLPIVGPWLVWVHVLQWQRSCCQLLVLGWSGYLCSNGSDRAANSWSLVGLVTCAPMAAIVLPIVGPWLFWVHVLQWRRDFPSLSVMVSNLFSNGVRLTAQSRTRMTAQSRTRTTAQSRTRMMVQSRSTMTAQSRTRTTARSRTTAQSRTRMTVQSQSTMTAQSRTRTTVQSRTRTTVQSRARMTARSLTRTTAQSRTRMTVQSRTRTTAVPSSSDDFGAVSDEDGIVVVKFMLLAVLYH